MGFAAGRSWAGVGLLAMAGICVLDVSDAFVHGPASLRPLARGSSSFMAGAAAGADTRMKLGGRPSLSSPAAGRRSMLPLLTMQQQKGPGSDGDADENPSTGTNFVDLGESAQKRFKGIDGLESPLTDPLSISQDVTPLAGFVLGAGGAVAASAVIPGLPATLPLIVTFILGYVAIVIEDEVDINKTATALIMGVLCWCFVGSSTGMENSEVLHKLDESLAEISQIVFFLMGAMSIVETVDAHKGFSIVTDKISTTDRRELLVITSVLAFFLSAVLDNLTTTIVMCSLLTKLVPDSEKDLRQVLGGITVIAANAGGAWSPIGDVTTTMLWIGGQVSVAPLVANVFLPSVVCTSVAVGIEWLRLGDAKPMAAPVKLESKKPRGQNLVFATGIGGLLFVPIFKSVTHLPPVGGMLISLGALWSLTDRLHGEDAPKLKMPEALKRIDFAGSLFFLGILMAVAAMETAGVLTQLSESLASVITEDAVLATVIGAASAVIDNVPLVAAAMGMYSLEARLPDSAFWDLIAYCAGTGGSMLIIGSAAGIAYMGLENVSFGWYLKKVSPAAVAGYLAGVATLVAQTKLTAGVAGGAAVAAAAATAVSSTGLMH